MFSESESDSLSLPPVEPSLSPASIQIPSPLPAGDVPSLTLDEDAGETAIPDTISNSGVEVLSAPSSPMNQASALSGIQTSSSPVGSSPSLVISCSSPMSVLPPPVSHSSSPSTSPLPSPVTHLSPPVTHLSSPVIHASSPVIHSSSTINSSSSLVTHSSPPPVANSLQSLMTPPRQSVKRQVICNDSPPVTPSRIVSVPQPILVTPVKPSVQSKSVEISPTKVLNEVEIPVVKNRTVALTTQLKRLLKEQEQERNRFRQQMKRQTTEMVKTFEIGLSRWNGVAFVIMND